MHHIRIREKRLLPQDGLILGNGDFSVSVYCDIGKLGFRLGKGDLWDRRLMYWADPEPVDIQEFEEGISQEGWKCGPHGGTEIIATKAPAKDPDRMRQVCQGCPPSYVRFPSPCPKPAGEFAMYLAPDLGYPTFEFDLILEEGLLNITAEFEEGYTVWITTAVDPEENLLLLQWQTRGFREKNYTGNRKTPVRFSLSREADRDLEEFSDAYLISYGRSPFFGTESNPLAVPLDKPEIIWMGDQPCVIQRIPAELTYPTGFACAMTLFGASGYRIADMPKSMTRGFVAYPKDPFEGKVFLGLETTGEDGTRATDKLKRAQALAAEPDRLSEAILHRLKAYNSTFWATSSMETEDKTFEACWYETIYLQRCAYQSGKQAPGLFLPSTLKDYTYWHGDYHTNYNIQQPFWGMPTSNHPELMKPYLELMTRWFLPLGRHIAEKYYHCRGCFIQLSGYPMVMPEDPLGVLPMGRMAYMTGFSMEQFWQYYRYTMDLDYLRQTGYPFMRECALFYHDFLTLGADGLYHAFPSNEGEDGFTGDSEYYRDCPEVILHIRQCLYLTLEAAKLVSPEDPLVPGLLERLNKLAPPRGESWPVLEALAQHRYECSSPRFGKVTTPYDGGDYREAVDMMPESMWMNCQEWYLGHDIDFVMLPGIRKGGSDAQAIWPFTRQEIRKWRRENGSLTGMCRALYGQPGIFTETFGITAVIGEMLLQSYDGAIGIFPCWPLDKALSFRDLRAEGAFLVSGACAEGKITHWSVYSEKGGLCSVYMDDTHTVWCEGREIPVIRDSYGRPAFYTEPGKHYELK